MSSVRRSSGSRLIADDDVRPVDPRDLLRRLPTAEYAVVWLDDGFVRPRTLEDYAGRLERHILPRLRRASSRPARYLGHSTAACRGQPIFTPRAPPGSWKCQPEIAPVCWGSKLWRLGKTRERIPMAPNGRPTPPAHCRSRDRTARRVRSEECNAALSSLLARRSVEGHLRSRTMWAPVTGGAGLIGSNLVDARLATGDEVHVVDNLSTGSCKNLASTAELHDLDIGDEAPERLAEQLPSRLRARSGVLRGRPASFVPLPSVGACVERNLTPP
jgi:NAD-dependent epimerase/dehydratase family protein